MSSSDSKYSSVAKASEGNVPESDQVTGHGLGRTQLRDSDPEWVRDDETE